MSRLPLRGWLSYWLGRSGSERTARSRSLRRQRRPLGLEMLEGRILLANDLAAIRGIVYTDRTDNGLTNDDLRVAGATVELYRDGGNGAFGGDDTLVATRTTDAQGAYQFNQVTAGTYFVRQVVPNGHIQKPGTGIVMLTVTPSAAAGTSTMTIDSFNVTNQMAAADSGGPLQQGTSAQGSDILGGERDLFAQLTSASGNVSLIANAYGQQLLEFTSSATGAGRRIVTWDGVDNSTNLNATGLGGVNLSNNGANHGIRLDIGADLTGGVATIRVYTDAGRWSQAQMAIPATGGSAISELVIPFTSFTPQAGGGANFANVGAIQLEIEGNAAVDGQIDNIAVVGPTFFDANFALYEPLTLGDTVFNDINNNGRRDPGDLGVPNVLVNLYIDSDLDNVFSATDQFVSSTTTNANGLYYFTNLLPNSYIVQLGPSNFAPGGPLVGYLSSTGNQPTPDPDDNVDDDDNGDPLANQGFVTRAVTLSIRDEPGSLTDSLGNSNLTVDFGVYIPTIDVMIDKSVNTPIATPGGTLTYTMLVTNNGPQPATGVTVTDVLPAGLTYISGTTTQGTIVGSGTSVQATIGGLAVGASATLTVLASVATTASGTLINDAVVSAIERETNLLNNRDRVTVTVDSTIDLAIDKSVAEDRVAPGDLLHYTLVVTNNGPSNGTGVTVRDQLPAGVTFVSATPSQGSLMSVLNGQIMVMLGSLANGASATIQVVASVDATTFGTIENVAQVWGNETETRLDNNRDNVFNDVVPPPVQAANASVSGFVYHDVNNNGIKEAGEPPIAGVVISLSGTDTDGNPVARTTTTDALGAYLFAMLNPGTYTITETQPTGYRDGIDTLGTPAGGVAGNDVFSNLVLTDAMQGVNYNFGELRVITKQNYLTPV